MAQSNEALLLQLLSLTVLLFITERVETNSTIMDNEQLNTFEYPPCAACKILVKSFKRGMETTKRGKFGGGDSAWEESKLGSYQSSETRLTEIQEKLCKDIMRGEKQCQKLAEELETTIEDWWINHQDNYPDIFDYLCIMHTERCCPKDHYGPTCTACPGFPNKVCNNNGKCKGAGTRKGGGGCVCDKGYEGHNCFDCEEGYYESYRDETKLLCSPCHTACEGLCFGAGPKNCEKCAQGWYKLDGESCIDIDECIKSSEVCPGNEFCINKEGGYKCMSCDVACDGCTGDGPDMCIKCAEGYLKTDNVCMNTDILERKWKENVTRYLTYVGLCIATCIIFQRNMFIASIIGLLVGVYISISEYMIAYNKVQDTQTNLDILGPP